MRIAFDAKRLFCNSTGLGNYSRTLVRALASQYPDNEYVLFTPRIRLPEQSAPFRSLPGVRTVLPRGLVRGSLWRSYSLAALVEREHCNVYHGLSHELPHDIRRSGARTVVTMHDVAWRTFPAMYKSYDRAIYDRKARHACRVADAVVCISEATARDVQQFYDVPREKLHVVYQPVQPHYYLPMEGAEVRRRLERMPMVPADYLLYVGSVNSRKNLLGAVQALELLPPSVRIPLLVVGGGREYKQKVEAYVAAHGLEQLVRFLPRVDDDLDLQALYTGACAFVYPSFYEGFGLPVVEAELCATPVVMSTVSCLPEAAGPYAETADPSSPEAIRDALLRLLDDDERRADLGRRAQDWAARTFSTQRFAEQMMQVYHAQ